MYLYDLQEHHMVVYCQNLANMFLNSVTIQSLLRIRKNIKNFNFRGHSAHKCKTSGVFAKRHVA